MLSESYNIIYLLTNLFSIAILHRFMTSFFDKRQTSGLVCILSYLSHFILTSLAYLLFDIPVLTVVVNCLVIFGITLNYQSTMQNRILISINIILFMSITEIIIGVISGYFHFTFLSKGNYKDVIGLIIARLSAYMIALMFKNFKSLKKNQKVNSFEWTASIFIPITTMVLEVMIIESESITQGKAIISLLLVFLLNLIAFYLYDSLADSYSKSARLSVLEKENQLYSKQCEIMQESTEELQTFRHDLGNQFAVISELLESEKYELVKSHLSTLTSEIDHSVIFSTTGNVVIDGLINYKLQCAVNDHIKVDSEIAVPNDLEIDTVDISTIIGNLLDNAIRAVRELPETKRSLTIKVMYSKDRLIIQMINPYGRELEYQNGEIVTTKQDKANHGYGLKSVERVVEKYGGYSEINTNNNLFKIDILLYLVK